MARWLAKECRSPCNPLHIISISTCRKFGLDGAERAHSLLGFQRSYRGEKTCCDGSGQRSVGRVLALGLTVHPRQQIVASYRGTAIDVLVVLALLVARDCAAQDCSCIDIPVVPGWIWRHIYPALLRLPNEFGRFTTAAGRRTEARPAEAWRDRWKQSLQASEATSRRGCFTAVGGEV